MYFNYPANLEDFNYLIEDFMQIKSDYVNSELGENIVTDCLTDYLIVMDNVSGLADKSDIFSNFLTVSRKYGFSCLYVFHTIYPNRQNWEMIMSQTHILNFFPGSIHSEKILRTLSLFTNRYKNSYIASRNIWLNKLYFDISTSKQKMCLTIDTRTINDHGPSKFRTNADNGIEQICYYNRNKSDVHFNSFRAKREQTSEIRFAIDKITTGLCTSDVRFLNIKNDLKNTDNDNFQSKLKQLGRGNTTTRESRSGDRNEQRKRTNTEHRRVSKKPRFLSG